MTGPIQEPPLDDNADDPAAECDPTETDELNRRTFTIRRQVSTRLDVYLQQRLKGISRSRVKKLIDLQGVKVNQQTVKASTTVHAGDVIDVILPAASVRTIEPQPIPLDIIHEDEAVIVINKQAGVVVHPARSHLSGTLLNGLAYRFAQQQAASGREVLGRQTSGFRPMDPGVSGDGPLRKGSLGRLSSVGAKEFRPGIIHRLDKNTTGVIVVAKTDEAHWAIARQFEDRSTLKAYLAVVHGNPEPAGGAIDHPIGKHPTIREAYAVRHDSSAKASVTLYRVREQYKGYALVELELKTGRTHQIRVHLSYLGYPIVGDVVYGGEPVGAAELDAPLRAAGSRPMLTFARDKLEGQRVEREAAARDDLIIGHPALHATLLEFQHPLTGERSVYTAPLHEPMAGLVRQLRHRRMPDASVATSGYHIDLGAAIPDAPVN